LRADRRRASYPTVYSEAAALWAADRVTAEVVVGVASRPGGKRTDGAAVVLADARGSPDSTSGLAGKRRWDRSALGEAHTTAAGCCAKDAIVVGDAPIRARWSVTTAVGARALMGHSHARTAGLARVAIGLAVGAAHWRVLQRARAYPRATGARVATSAAAAASSATASFVAAAAGRAARVSGWAHRPATDGEQNGQ